MTKDKIIKILYFIFAAALFLTCALAFFMPFSQKTGAACADEYECVWQNGKKTRESYYSAYSSLCGIEGESIVLERNGEKGYIFSPETAEAERTLRCGWIAQLLALDCSRLKALERAALVRSFAGVLYYCQNDYFAFTGTRVERTRKTQTQTLALLMDVVPPSAIGGTLAKEIWVAPDTVITAKAFVGTRVERIVAREPYTAYGDALYLNTEGGRKLIAGLPNVKSLCIGGNDFAEEGALLACVDLEEITVSFAGSHGSGIGSEYRGEFAFLFSRGGKSYAVPPTLKKITVTGGKLISHAFYACTAVEEIYACGAKEEDIDEYAFIDCSSLRVLHVPKTGVRLPEGNYDVATAPCGCGVYERRSS